MPDTIPSIKRTGVIFKPGNYGAKGEYSDADIDAMAGDTPLPVNLEHRKSLLDGRLGELTRRFSGFDENGNKVLMGEWNEPAPLAQLLGDTVRKASIEIDLKTKQPVGLALTHLPHISEAALFSAVEDAYAKFSRGEEIVPLAPTTPQENTVMTQTAAATPQEQEQPKGFMAQLSALFSGAKPEELQQAETALTTAKTGKTPREIELEQRVAKFEADEAQQNAAKFSTNAVEEADKLVLAGKFAAKGNEDYNNFVAAFTAAQHVDASRDSIACFSGDTPAVAATFSMTEYLRTTAEKLPKHDGTERTGDLTPDQIAVFEHNKTTAKDKDGETVDWDEVNKARREAGLPEKKAE